LLSRRTFFYRVWGHNVGTLEAQDSDISNVYYSWRDMFIRRERVLFNGCYISKTTFSGDASKKYHNLASDLAKQLDLGQPDASEGGEEVVDNLYEKFQQDLRQDNIYNGKMIASSRDAGVLTTGLHFADLPPEIVMRILRWVVSAQLDMRSLEQCAAVSKGFYVYARDEELWRLACVK